MHDSKWIIIGLIVLLLLISSPLDYILATGKAGYAPGPEPPAKAEECIEPKEWMIDNHQHLLNDWRHSVFREDKRTYVASDGEEYEINLMTCLDCHSKQQFCDRCHNYVGVEPGCWNCHVAPEEK